MPHFGTALFQWNDHNLLPYSEDISQWSQVNSPINSSGQTDPFGGTGAWLVNDDDAAAQEYNRVFLAANTHNTDGAKAIMIYMKAGTSTQSAFAYWDIGAAAYRALLRVSWLSTGPSATGAVGTLLWSRQLTDGWWHFGIQTTTAVLAASSHEVLILGAENSTQVGTVYVYGASILDTNTAGSYVATNGSAIAYSTTSPAQSHSLQAPLRALRPAVRTMPFVRESLDLTQRQVTTVADPRHETVGEIRYESDQESFHTFLAAAARFPVTYVPASSNLSDAHECWAIVNDPLDSVMDADRGFPGFEDVSLEIRLRRLDGQPCTGIYG